MLTTHELRARANNLLAEQAERQERDRRRKEKEEALKRIQREREAAREEQARLKRLEEAAAEEKAAHQRIEEREWNRGVFLEATLSAVEADDEAAVKRGIRRNKDKVLLPPSMSNALMDQDAAKNGAMQFQLRSHVTGATTHCGVLEFTSPEGVVALPRKVRECLFGNGGAVQGSIDVKYKRLEKGTFVRLQPLSRGFHEAVDDVKALLEETLLQHSTLTVGDTLHVVHQGNELTLRVSDLQPAQAVSIIDTDIEAEIVASVETERLIQEWEEEQRQNAARLADIVAAREAEAAEAAAAAIAAAEEASRRQREAEERAAEAERERVQRQAALLAALPPEPPADSALPAVQCAFRLPDGQRVSRRFLTSAHIHVLFQFVDAFGAGGCDEYDLITQFPRRVISRPQPEVGSNDSGVVYSSGLTLESLGLGKSGPELFLLEPVVPE